MRRTRQNSLVVQFLWLSSTSLHGDDSGDLSRSPRPSNIASENFSAYERTARVRMVPSDALIIAVQLLTHGPQKGPPYPRMSANGGFPELWGLKFSRIAR